MIDPTVMSPRRKGAAPYLNHGSISNRGVDRTPKTLQGAVTPLITAAELGTGMVPVAIVVTGGEVYAALNDTASGSSGRLVRKAADGSGTLKDVTPPFSRGVFSLAVDATHVYWCETGGGTGAQHRVRRVPLLSTGAASEALAEAADGCLEPGPEPERRARTPNAEHRTPSAEHRTPNAEHRTLLPVRMVSTRRGRRRRRNATPARSPVTASGSGSGFPFRRTFSSETSCSLASPGSSHEPSPERGGPTPPRSGASAPRARSPRAG